MKKRARLEPDCGELKVGFKNHDPDNHRPHRRNEHRARGDVLGAADAHAVFLRNFVGQDFDGGVEGLQPSRPNAMA